MEEVDYLKAYIRRLRTKLGDDPQNPELIHTERGVGDIFPVRLRTGDTPARRLRNSLAVTSSESAGQGSYLALLPEYDVTKASNGKDKN